MNIEDLQKDYPVFSYDSFSMKTEEGKLVCSFQFSCCDRHFVTTDTLDSISEDLLSRIPTKELETYVFHLGLSEIATYWKAFCSPMIEIKCGSLNEAQIQFWQKLFYHGLGEFFYINKIKPFFVEIKTSIVGKGSLDFDPALRVIAQDDNSKTTPENLNMKPSVLVPVGGGKDSIVTLELLAQASYPIVTFSGSKGASPEVVGRFTQKYPTTKNVHFSRVIDSQILALNAEGHPNGHTPFSSVLAFLTLFAARLFDIPYIALSNEGSASEPTGTWEGIDINHQYSKSQEFEKDFQEYVKQTFTKGTGSPNSMSPIGQLGIEPREYPGSKEMTDGDAPSYFSFLRPLYELQIMNIFVKYPEYFPVFHSCNVGQKTNSWCKKCGKCVFVAILLAAFVDDETITSIFGTNMMEDMSLSEAVDELIGVKEFKPFECVGTRTESQAALYLAIERRSKNLPALLLHYEQWAEEKEDELKKTAREVLKSFDQQHRLPEEFIQILQHTIEQ